MHESFAIRELDGLYTAVGHAAAVAHPVHSCNLATADNSLHTALATADLEDCTTMASSLLKLGLSNLLEVQLLHAQQAAKMWASLRESAVLNLNALTDNYDYSCFLARLYWDRH